LQQRFELGFGVFRLADEATAVDAQLPVALHLDAAAGGVEHEARGRRKFLYARQYGARRGYVFEREILGERVAIDLARHRRMLEERRQRRGEREARAVDVIVERLLAEAIAREEEPAQARVPQREGEHTVELAHAVGAPLPVRVQDALGVGARGEAMPERLEARAQIREVVHLAVEDDDAITVGRGHRLMAAGEIEDRQAAEREHGRAVGEGARVVGAARAHRLAHGLDAIGVAPRARRIDDAGDPAHVSS